MKMKKALDCYACRGFAWLRQAASRGILLSCRMSAEALIEASLEQAFKAIDELVGHLKRGDRLTIIPILGDAQAEASGRIIRFEVPISRTAYDSDLRQFSVKIKTSLEEIRSASAMHPGAKTDILGSITLANQELQTDGKDARRSVIILSDFIQEDDELNFKSDKKLSDLGVATNLSAHMASESALDFHGVPVYLGLLRSNEYARLGRNRRTGIQAFWMSYFKSIGGKPKFVSDGPGLLERFVEIRFLQEGGSKVSPVL